MEEDKLPVQSIELEFKYPVEEVWINIRYTDKNGRFSQILQKVVLCDEFAEIDSFKLLGQPKKENN